MAIQPIDLQIMYSQMSNVAKIASQQQKGSQLTEAMQQNKMIQQAAEEIASVQKSASEDNKSSEVKPDGHQGSKQQMSKQNNQKDDKDSEPEVKKEIEIRESYLGQHIDITR